MLAAHTLLVVGRIAYEPARGPLPDSAEGTEALETNVFSTKPTVYGHPNDRSHARAPKRGGSHKRAHVTTTRPNHGWQPNETN